MLWVPPGLAHGILVTSPSADFLYKCTDFYSPRGRAHARLGRSRARHQVAAARGRRAGAVGQGCARQELRRHREIRVRVLVLGAGGQVGRAVVRAMAGRHEVIARARAELDIADAAESGRSHGARSSPTGSSMRAAYTAVDLAEDEPARAAAINDDAVGILADGRGAGRQPAAAPVDGLRVRRRRRIAPICRAMPPQPVERLRRDQTCRRETGRSRAAAQRSCCAPRGCMPPPARISCSPCSSSCASGNR